MQKRFLFLLVLLAFAGGFLPQQAMAQVASPIDTFKIANIQARAGDTVNVKLFVVNNTCAIGAIQALVKIDTSKLEMVGVWDSTVAMPTFYVTANLIERGLLPGLFKGRAGDLTPFQIMTSESNSWRDTMFFNIFGAGDSAEVPIGRGNICQFKIRVKPGLAIGTKIPLRLFNPDMEIGLPYDTRYCEFWDMSGINGVQPPTLVSGYIEVDTSTVLPPAGQNTPPVISPISPSSYTVQPPGQTVSFTVTATDADAPQRITLTANNRPSGATFGTGGVATGAGVASSTFNWTPTLAQAGTYQVVFTCKDDSNATATPRTVTINVGTAPPPEEDLLYSASSKNYKAYSGGIPGLTGVSIPINLSISDAGTSVYGVQFDFVYQTSVMMIDSIVPTERLANFTIYDNSGATPGRVRVVAFGLQNQTMQPGTLSGTAIFNFWVSVKASAPTGESPVRFENAWEAISPSPTVPSVRLNFDTTGVFIVDQFGDVNGDGRVDVADAVIVVGSIIGEVTLTHRQFKAADMDNSEVVDVVDLVAIVNAIFGGTAPTAPGWTGPDATLALGDENGAVGSDNVINVNADLPTDIAGVQVEISYNPAKMRFLPPQRTDLSQKLNIRYRDDGVGKLIVLLYPSSLVNSRIAAGSGTVIKLPIIPLGDISPEQGDINIAHAVLADPKAVKIPIKGEANNNLPTDFTLDQNYPNPFNPETTIEFAVGVGSAFKSTKLVIYNLLGEKVNTLVDGPLAAGKYSFKWRGDDSGGRQVASGVYFYRLTIGDLAQTKKMVLMK
jgi:hypothetical protein